MAKECVLCNDEESDEVPLLRLPCQDHWVCKDCVPTFFEMATNSEARYPPQCCNQILMLQEWEDYIPHEVQWEFQCKEQGEYAVLPKFRVYCANTSCAKFLRPDCHITDPDTKYTYAICEADKCGKATCVSCKSLLDQGIQKHTCEVAENDKKFKETAEEKGYQECYVCSRTIELAEACNHITCECGHSFCYICGKDWTGIHGCPQYGPAHYDEEGYNQDGYHKETGLNRDGRTRRQQAFLDGGEDDEFDEEDDEDPDEDVLQHVTAEDRAAIDAIMDPEERQATLAMLRIELFETQGIMFNQQVNHGHHQHHHGDDENQDEDDVDRDGEDEDWATFDDVDHEGNGGPDDEDRANLDDGGHEDNGGPADDQDVYEDDELYIAGELQDAHRQFHNPLQNILPHGNRSIPGAWVADDSEIGDGGRESPASVSDGSSPGAHSNMPNSQAGDDVNFDITRGARPGQYGFAHSPHSDASSNNPQPGSPPNTDGLEPMDAREPNDNDNDGASNFHDLPSGADVRASLGDRMFELMTGRNNPSQEEADALLEEYEEQAPPVVYRW